jgi:outer membrane protein assembly factor BamE (lipoprotein component of BamABCDE complex)
MHSFRIVLVILIATATLLLMACPFPVPPRSFGTRENIDDKLPAFIKEGVTTREDVFMKLGEPDTVAIDDSWILYVSGRGRGGLGFFMAAGGAAAGVMFEASHYRRLIIQFNAADIVVFAALETKNCPVSTAGISGSRSGHSGRSRPCLDIQGSDIPGKYNWPDRRPDAN